MRFTLGGGSSKRDYVNAHGLFALYGNNVTFQPHLLPLYSQLIKIHDNVVIGRNVEFVTHDVIHQVFNRDKSFPSDYRERIGCIEVGENCFVGNGAIILYGVRIAPRCIIAAGSVVTHDTESDSVYAGVPARRIGSYTDLAARLHDAQREGVVPTVLLNQRLSAEEAARAWEMFDEVHRSVETESRSGNLSTGLSST